jgi:hypothetical protein
MQGEVYQKFRKQIADISQRYGIPWNYRPLHGQDGPG